MGYTIKDIDSARRDWPFKDAGVGDVFEYPVLDDGEYLKAQRAASSYSSSNGKGAKFTSRTISLSDGGKLLLIGRVK